MRRLILALAIAVAAIAVSAPGATADGPLKLKRTVVVKRGVKSTAKHFVFRTVLRSPGKGIVGTARVRCGLNRCSVRTKFSEGRVTARGKVGGTGSRETIPIVGGNGGFRHASGTLIVRPDRKGRSLWIYKLESFG